MQGGGQKCKTIFFLVMLFCIFHVIFSNFDFPGGAGWCILYKCEYVYIIGTGIGGANQGFQLLSFSELLL